MPEGRRTIHPDTEDIIRKRFGVELLALSTQEQAVDMLDRANQHPHHSTKLRIEETSGLLLDGPFCADVSGTLLSRAFSLEDGSVRIVKLSADPSREIEAFRRLNLEQEDAVAAHIVPLQLFSASDETRKSRSVLSMPPYQCALDAMPRIPPHLLIRGVTQIREALTVLHNHGVYHMDVKPANILIGNDGNWNLTDFDSCRWDGDGARAKLTTNYIPRDFSRIPSRRFDLVLLAVTAVVMFDSSKLRLGDFTFVDLQRAITDITRSDSDDVFGNLLTELLC